MRKDEKTVSPLYSLEAETSVIGGLLLKPDCFDEVSAVLQTQDFYLAHHRHIFSAISLFAQKNKPFDILTLSEHFKTKGFKGLQFLIHTDCATNKLFRG